MIDAHDSHSDAKSKLQNRDNAMNCLELEQYERIVYFYFCDLSSYIVK